MEAKKRGRGRPPSTEATDDGTRKTRGKAPAANMKPAAAIPRRGAQAQVREGSILSIPTQVGHESDDDREQPNAEKDDESDENVRRGILASALPDIARASDEIVQRLRQGDYNSGVFRGVLKMRRGAFRSTQEYHAEFQPAEIAPFIERITLFDEENQNENEVPAQKILARFNMAIALDRIDERLLPGSEPDFALLFRGLNSTFPDAFEFPNEVAVRDAQLLLDVRTQVAIDAVADLKGQGDASAAIANVFCVQPSDNSDYARLFSHGPFNPLNGGDEDRDSESELITDRITAILTIVRKDKKTNGLAQLKKKFPADDVLDRVRAYLNDAYPDRKAEMPAILSSKNRSAAERDEFHDAEEEIPDSAASASESQVIIRATSQQKQAQSPPSLFKGRSSLKVLNQDGQALQKASAPDDYEDDTNSMLLGGSTRAGKQPATEGDDADGDAFETDMRPVKGGKRGAASSAAPAPKRQRQSGAMAPPPRPAGSPSAPGPAGSPNRSSLPDFAAIKEEKRRLLQEARSAQGGPAQRQRHPWSDRDCAQLLECIVQERAAWAQIETKHTASFEHPRNQQAYRDKARNMKVDYLMTDAVLPPCFDLVALGKKEMDRLMGMGKNPWRKENDVDDDGKPINTEL